MQYVGGEKLAGKKALAPAVSFPGGGAAHLSGLPDGTTCSLAKRSASEEIAEPVAEGRWWWGKDYSALKRLALRAVACGNVLSLTFESNLSRSFPSFPIGQNIEYRR